MRRVGFVVLLVLALELAVWEAFLVMTRPLGRPLPLAAVLAVVGNLALGRAGAALLARPLGAALPGLLWLAVALGLGMQRAEGDVVVTESGRGLAFLFGGAIAAAVATATASARAARLQNRATPEGGSRR